MDTRHLGLFTAALLAALVGCEGATPGLSYEPVTVAGQRFHAESQTDVGECECDVASGAYDSLDFCIDGRLSYPDEYLRCADEIYPTYESPGLTLAYECLRDVFLEAVECQRTLGCVEGNNCVADAVDRTIDCPDITAQPGYLEFESQVTACWMSMR